ncbi:MAG TPA: serine/threonine-protein kinase [Polyangia bacterium]|nr:serine/threonine-protein kinase [Polyangia bacterium]
MGQVSSERGGWSGGVLLADTYLLGRPISRGGMGEVFEATHARLPGRYAVKILLPELIGHREAFARFCREAEVMSELRHPNVVQIFDFNTTPDGRPYFVMEFLEGRDLETRLNDAGPLPLPFAVRVVDAVASALAAAHAHGIVHRDLKPANIFLVTVDGQPDELIKVLDFGISKVRAAGTLLSTPSDVLGTPPYMSPEQARGATHLIDGRTDQFALGAITYRMLTGHDPFTGNDIASLLYQVVHQAPPPLSRYVPASWDTRALQAVLDRAMAKDPGQRWTGMLEMARAFEAASEQTLSRLPDGQTPDPGAARPLELSDTLIAAPPPAPASFQGALATPTPVVQPLPLVRQAAPMATTDATAPALVTDEPPPVRTPTPVVLPAAPEAPATPPVLAPRAAPAAPAFAGRGAPAVLGTEHTPRRDYDWEPTGSLDELPRQRRGLAVFAVLVAAAAVVLAVTGTYRRIPAAIAAAVQVVRGRAATPAPAPPPAADTAPPTAAPSPAPEASKPTVPEDEPPARSTADRPARTTSERPAKRSRGSRSGAVHYVDHPGTIDLSPGSAAPGEAAPRGEPTQPPGADSAPSFGGDRSSSPARTAPAPAAPSAPGFDIAPPAPLGDTPSRDIAPPATGDGDQPLPPSVR